MERKIVETVRKYVGYLETVQSSQVTRSDDLKDYDDLYLQVKTLPNGNKYYSFRHRGEKKFKYLGKEDCKDVQLIKESHYYKEALPAIQSNLDICRNLLDVFRFTDYDSINDALPKVYRDPVLHIPQQLFVPKAQKWKTDMEAYKESCGPWYPEDLKVTTADRNLVRSKSEGMIYNQYLSLGATYVYELPIILKPGGMRHPDFTILSEVDWTSIILHDHEGMYGFESERKRYNEDMYLYWQNGFIPGINIFYTFDDPRGGFDISVVNNIMDTKIRPGHRSGLENRVRS